MNIFHLHNIFFRDKLEKHVTSYITFFELCKKNKIKKIYFIEHYPWFKNSHSEEFGDRLVPYTKLYSERINIKTYAKKYNIQVFFGAEIEGYQSMLTFFNGVKNDLLFNYCILGIHNSVYYHIHFLNNNSIIECLNKSNNIEIFENWTLSQVHKYLKEYVNIFEYYAKKKYITHFAHPDIWIHLYIQNNFAKDKIYYDTIENICVIAKKYNIPLEFNAKRYVGDINKNTTSSDSYFWDFACKSGCKIIIGWDSHSWGGLNRVLNNYDNIIKHFKKNKWYKNLITNIKLNYINANLNIDVINKSELPYIEKMEETYFLNDNSYYNLKQLNEIFENKNYQIERLKYKNKIIGYYIICISDIIELEKIVVDKKYLHNGYGTMMLNNIIAKYGKDINIEVNCNNKFAIKFYQANNFKQVRIRKNYYGSNIDALIFRYYINA